MSSDGDAAHRSRALDLGIFPPYAYAEQDTLQTLARVRLSVSTPELIRVLSGAPMSKKQLRREQFIGTLQGRRDDDVVIRVGPPETELAVPAKLVERIEYSRGMHGCGVEGASIGALAGFAGGFVMGLVVCSSGDCESTGSMVVATYLGGIGVLAGAGIGAITGSQMRCEKWRAIPLKDLPYGEGLPQEYGIRFGLALPTPRH